MRISGIIILVALLTGCASSKTINGHVYEPYGFANESAEKSPDVIYELSAGSCIAGILFSETIIVPGYVLGWDLWEPVRAKSGADTK